MTNYNYLGLYFLITLENIFPPIPAEVILTLAGFMAHTYNISLFLIILASSLGSLSGSLILYFLGYFFTKDNFKIKFLKKLIKEDKIQTSLNWFNKQGYKCIFLGRFIPIIRSLISIPAGINKMPLFKFLLYTFLGSTIWNTTLILIGYLTHQNFNKILNFYNTSSKIILFLLIIFIIYLLIIYKVKKKHYLK